MRVRVFSFIALSVLGVLSPLPLFLFCAFLYVLFWKGHELLLIALCIDSVFGVDATAYYYTGGVGILLIVSAVLKPHMSWYTTDTL